MSFVPENIPQELMDKRQWVNWDLEIRDGKQTKVPKQPNGRNADSTDPGTWSDFDTCMRALENGSRFKGIGFVFNHDYTGTDFDDCVRNGGIINPDVARLVAQLNSYTEYSQSGRGLHVINNATKTGVTCRNGGSKVEMYDSCRFFCMTGDLFDGCGPSIEQNQDDVDKVYYDVFGDEMSSDRSQGPAVSHVIALDDDVVIEKASAARNGDKFKRLFFDGDCSDYPSSSEADLALCDMLRFYCGDAPSRIDELFRASELMRPKWTEKRGSQTYGEMTIGKSLGGGDVCGGNGDSNGSISSISIRYGDPYQYFTEGDKNGKNKRFVPKKLGDALLEGHHFLRFLDTNEIFVNNPDTRLFEENGEALILKEAQERLDELSNTHHINEALNYIRNSDYVRREEVETPVNLIPAANGVLDVSAWLNGEYDAELIVSDYSPDVPMFVKHTGAYRPDLLEHPSMTKKFIDSIFPEDEIDSVQEMVSACLYREQLNKKAFMLLGDGDNGKSIFLNMLRKMLGESVVSKQSLYALAHNRFASSDLYHRNANIHADLGGGDLAFVGTFMILTGGDSLTVERKHQHSFSYVCYAVLIFSTNALPDVKNPPDQFYNRWILVEMPYKFVDHPDPDSDFEKQRLPEHELEAALHKQDEIDYLFTWGIQGLKRLLQNGHYTESNSTKAIKSRWVSKTDSLQAFVNEMVEENTGSRVLKTVFKSEYATWCGANGMYAQTDANIGKNLPRFIPTKSIQTKPRSWANIVIRGVAAERMTDDEMSLNDGQTSFDVSELRDDEQFEQ